MACPPHSTTAFPPINNFRPSRHETRVLGRSLNSTAVSVSSTHAIVAIPVLLSTKIASSVWSISLTLQSAVEARYQLGLAQFLSWEVHFASRSASLFHAHLCRKKLA